MAENLDGITQRLAGFIGLREAGKLGSEQPLKVGKLPIERTIIGVNEARKGIEVYRKNRKYHRGELTDEDMDKVTELARNVSENTVAINQGVFESKISNTVNLNKVGPTLQADHEIELGPREIPTRDGKLKETVDPLDVIHEIANFENNVYDGVMRDVLKAHGVSSIDKVVPNEAIEIRREVENKMDETVREIGLNYMRGQVPVVGKHFLEKAIKTIEKYANKNKKIDA